MSHTYPAKGEIEHVPRSILVTSKYNDKKVTDNQTARVVARGDISKVTSTGPNKVDGETNTT